MRSKWCVVCTYLCLIRKKIYKWIARYILYFRSGRISFMEEILDVISLALNVLYILIQRFENHQIRILKEKKSIFRSSVSSVDIALFSLIRGRGNWLEKWNPWFLSVFFPWNWRTKKPRGSYFSFQIQLGVYRVGAKAATSMLD